MSDRSPDPRNQFTAETAYLFRHALLRDAAYELQLPTARARLHELAFLLIENTWGGRAPSPPALEAAQPEPCAPHPADAVAQELADHARMARANRESGLDLASLERLYLHRGALAASRLYRHDDAIRCWKALSKLLQGAAAAEALRLAGDTASQVGRLSDAHSLLAESLSTACACCAESVEAKAHANLAGMYTVDGKHELAQEYFEQALAIQRQLGNQREVGNTLGNLAKLLEAQGRNEQAERASLEALHLHRLTGNRRSEGVTLSILGQLYLNTGRVTEAEQHFTQALSVHREIGNRRSEGIVLGQIAVLYRQTGRMQEAENSFGQALTLHRQVGNRPFEGMALGRRAVVYLNSGRTELARQDFESALAIAREHGDVSQAAVVLGNLAVLHSQLGDFDQAEKLHLEALTLHRAVRNRAAEGTVLGNLGLLFQHTGRLELSENYFRQALQTHHEVSNHRMAACHGCDFALLRLLQGHAQEAKQRWLDAAAELRRLGDSAQLQRQRAFMLQACAAARVPPLDGQS